MGKTIVNAVVTRRNREPFGLRLIGGKDEGKTIKVVQWIPVNRDQFLQLKKPLYPNIFVYSVT